ncbi:hypothetical protein BH24ACT14_BH24ACT14_03480 [soil metagenome]
MGAHERAATPTHTGRRLRGHPDDPGVYAFYRDGTPVYVGVATRAGGLQRRLQREHLNTGHDLSRSAFRRNVAEHLGVATVAQAKQRPSVMTDEQVDAVNAWVAGCQVAWMETSSGKQAGQLEKELKSERRPPLTKR